MLSSYDISTYSSSKRLLIHSEAHFLFSRHLYWSCGLIIIPVAWSFGLRRLYLDKSLNQNFYYLGSFLLDMSVQMSCVVLAVFYKRATKYVTCLEFQMAFAIRIWKTESQEVLISSLLGNFQRDYHTTCIRLNYSWHLDHSFTCSSHVFMRLIQNFSWFHLKPFLKNSWEGDKF